MGFCYLKCIFGYINRFNVLKSHKAFTLCKFHSLNLLFQQFPTKI